MGNIFSSVIKLCFKSFWIFSLASLMIFTTLLLPQYSYASPEVKAGSEEIVQPFELTRPAETREDAYEEAAKLTENPKELIKAQNQEEKAQEKVLKQ